MITPGPGRGTLRVLLRCSHTPCRRQVHSRRGPRPDQITVTGRVRTGEARHSYRLVRCHSSTACKSNCILACLLSPFPFILYMLLRCFPLRITGDKRGPGTRSLISASPISHGPFQSHLSVSRVTLSCLTCRPKPTTYLFICVPLSRRPRVHGTQGSGQAHLRSPKESQRTCRP
jgi:hypothetical protein